MLKDLSLELLNKINHVLFTNTFLKWQLAHNSIIPLFESLDEPLKSFFIIIGFLSVILGLNFGLLLLTIFLLDGQFL